MVSATTLLAALSLWVIDDGEKIKRDEVDTPFERGAENPVWRPGEPIRLFALRGETVAFQVVIEGPADGVTLEVSLEGIASDRFVEHFFEIEKPSSTRGSAESLGWVKGSGPPPGRFTGFIPDALIPVEIAPAWSPWPMRVAAGQNGIVWIDLHVPSDRAPGLVHGEVKVAGRTIPLELEVLPHTLPAHPVRTMLFYDPGNLRKRVGGGEKQLWDLFRKHRLTPLHSVGSVEDVAALDGEDDIVVLGTYGTFGDPTPDKLATVEKIADALAARRLFEKSDVILYAEDEDCASPRGAGWRALIASSKNANARKVRVAWTCDEDPAKQPVDLAMVAAQSYVPDQRSWIYNGQRPFTGTLFTDNEAISTRTFGWIAAMAAIPRWFIWETTFWYDGNKGGHGPYDPFVTAETFHNKDGEAAMGDGVLVYPGRQIDRFTDHSIGFEGVLPSIRLKNLRRGVEDAGYYKLARASNPPEAERIARALFPRILQEAKPGAPPSWGERGKPFFEARRALAALIKEGADPEASRPLEMKRAPFRFRLRYLALPVAIVLFAIVLYLRKRI
jgi:hypothetical protein